jgi:hypothetical protein
VQGVQVNQMTRITTPPHRLYQHQVGDKVILKGVKRLINGKEYIPEFTVNNIRHDGYYELFDKGRLVVTASRCHGVV